LLKWIYLLKIDLVISLKFTFDLHNRLSMKMVNSGSLRFGSSRLL